MEARDQVLVTATELAALIEAGDALAREKIVERMGLAFEPVLEIWYAGGGGKRQRRSGLVQGVEGQQLVKVAERSDPHALVIEPVAAGTDRITRRLAQFGFVGRGRGGKRRRKERGTEQEDQTSLH